MQDDTKAVLAGTIQGRMNGKISHTKVLPRFIKLAVSIQDSQASGPRFSIPILFEASPLIGKADITDLCDTPQEFPQVAAFFS